IVHDRTAKGCRSAAETVGPDRGLQAQSLRQGPGRDHSRLAARGLEKLMDAPSPPPPPDPMATARAQGQINKETAIAQARLNAVNQVTPYGNFTYEAGPEVEGVPQYTATQTFTPEQPHIFETG